MKFFLVTLFIALFVSCSPDSGSKAIQANAANNQKVYQGEISGEMFKLNELNLSLNIGTDWTWLSEKTQGKPKYFFKHSSKENTTLYLSVINQKKEDFAKNLTQLSKTYDHLLKKYIHIEESIDRVSNKKSYYLKFGFFNDKLNEQMISQVYNVQLDDNTLATVTFSMPEKNSGISSEQNEKLIAGSTF